MGGNSFELLMQEILNQKQRMDELLEENHTLRGQLADLRVGHGIILEICGQQFALNTSEVPVPSEVVSLIQDAPVADQATIRLPLNEIAVDSIPETPRPNSNQIEQMPESLEQAEQETAVLPTFLEEMLIDEFAAASTTQMPAWHGTQTRKLPAIDEIDENEKAALRKQLIGSFLLE